MFKKEDTMTFMSKTKIDFIEDILGKPYYRDKNIILYNMDSLIGMEKLSNSKLVNLTVTSPPYNIGKEYEKNMSNGQKNG